MNGSVGVATRLAALRRRYAALHRRLVALERALVTCPEPAGFLRHYQVRRARLVVALLLWHLDADALLVEAEVVAGCPVEPRAA